MDEPAVIVGNNIAEPEYDFLSRQPSEVVEETYKVINLKPSSKFHLKPRPATAAAGDAKGRIAPSKKDSGPHPTGLVTKLGGTVIKDGVTTVHSTSVIGTYISGKYAQVGLIKLRTFGNFGTFFFQVLQSTSHIVNNHQKPKISPSPTLRILKTAAPAILKANKHLHPHNLEPTPAGSIVEETALPVENLFNSQEQIKSTRKPGGLGAASFKSRFKNRPREQELEEDSNDSRSDSAPAYKKNKPKVPTTARPNSK